MGNAALLDCILQCGHDKFLPYKFFKILRSLSGCGNFVSHRIMIASKTPWDYLVRKNHEKNKKWCSVILRLDEQWFEVSSKSFEVSLK